MSMYKTIYYTEDDTYSAGDQIIGINGEIKLFGESAYASLDQAVAQIGNNETAIVVKVASGKYDSFQVVAKDAGGTATYQAAEVTAINFAGGTVTTSDDQTLDLTASALNDAARQTVVQKLNDASAEEGIFVNAASLTSNVAPVAAAYVGKGSAGSSVIDTEGEATVYQEQESYKNETAFINDVVSNVQKNDSLLSKTEEEVVLTSKIEGGKVVWEISNLAEFKAFRDMVNGGTDFKGQIVRLTADIDLNNEEWAPIGTSTNIFKGTFDGAGKTISNLKITGYNSNVGLFGFTTDGEIKNFTLNNAQISGRLNVGAVAGTPYTSKYSDITLTGLVQISGMSYVGGIGGKNAYANWNNITINAAEGSYVKATSIEDGKAYRTYVGGVIGFIGEGGHSFTNISSNINVSGSTCDVGGIAGIGHYSNNFENISCSGNVEITDASELADMQEMGGLIGTWHNENNTGVTIINGSFTGSLTGTVVDDEGNKTIYTDESAELAGNKVAGSSYNKTGDGVLLSGTHKTDADGNTIIDITASAVAGDRADAVLDKYLSDNKISNSFVETDENGNASISLTQSGLKNLYDDGKNYVAVDTTTTLSSVKVAGDSKLEISGNLQAANTLVGAGGDTYATVYTPAADETKGGTLILSGDNIRVQQINSDNKGEVIVKGNVISPVVVVENGGVEDGVAGNLTVEEGASLEGVFINTYGGRIDVKGDLIAKGAGGEHKGTILGIHNNGIINVDGGSISTNRGIVIDAGSELKLTNATLSTVNFYNESADFFTGNIVNNGLITIDATSTLTAQSLSGDGSITIDATGFTGGLLKIIDLSGDTSLNGKVTINNLADGVYAVYGADGDVILSDISMETIYVNAAYSGDSGKDLGNGKILGINAFADFESAIAAAANDANVSRIEVESDITQSLAKPDELYNITQNLVIGVAQGGNFKVSLDRTAGSTFSIYQMGNNSSVQIEEGLALEGVDIVANGFYTYNNKLIIDGSVSAMSLKQWTSNNEIIVSETGKVTLGYGDGQFDMAYGNGSVTINGNFDENIDFSALTKDDAQFKAGYSGYRGNGNVLNLNNTYFEAGAWFSGSSNNFTLNADNTLFSVGGGDSAGKLEFGGTGSKINLKNGSLMKVANVTIGAGSELNIDGSDVKITSLTNNGSVTVTGESTLNIGSITAGELSLREGAIIKDSTVGGEATIDGNVIFRGDNTFVMLYDYGDYYSKTTPDQWTVEKGASLTLTKNDRYGLGYGDKVTVYGELVNAREIDRSTLTAEDASLNLYGGLVGMTNNAAPNAENSLTIQDAYVRFGFEGDKSFGNKPGHYGNYTINVTNSVFDTNAFKFYEDNGNSNVTFTDSAVYANGIFMTDDASSTFNFVNTTVFSNAKANGTDDKNQNAGTMNLTDSDITYSVKFTNIGTINLTDSAINSTEIVNNGTIVLKDASSLNADSISGTGWFYMNGVTLDADTNLSGLNVRFSGGENVIDGATVNGGRFQVGNGTYQTVDPLVDSENGVVVNVKNNAHIGGIDGGASPFGGWVGSAYYDSQADKDAVMTDARYTLNIENSIAEFGYLHISHDGIMNVSGNADELHSINATDYSFRTGYLNVNGVVTFDNVNAMAFNSNIGVDNNTATPGKLIITNGTVFNAKHYDSGLAATFNVSKTGVVEVSNGATFNIGQQDAVLNISSADAQFNIDNATVKAGKVINNGTLTVSGESSVKIETFEGVMTVTDANLKDGTSIGGTGGFETPDYVVFEGDSVAINGETKIMPRIEALGDVNVHVKEGATLTGSWICLCDTETTLTVDSTASIECTDLWSSVAAPSYARIDGTVNASHNVWLHNADVYGTLTVGNQLLNYSNTAFNLYGSMTLNGDGSPVGWLVGNPGSSTGYYAGDVTVNVAGGSVEITGKSKGNEILIATNGIFNIKDNGSVTVCGMATNNGQFNIDGGSFSTNYQFVNNSTASMSLYDAEFTLPGSLTNHGAITIGADSIITASKITGTGSVTIDASNFAGGTNKVLDLSDKTSMEGKVTVENLGEGVRVVYGADGDVILTDVAANTLYIDSKYTGVNGTIVDGKVVGDNAFASAKDAFAQFTTNATANTTVEVIEVTGTTNLTPESGKYFFYTDKDVKFTAGGSEEAVIDVTNPALASTNERFYLMDTIVAEGENPADAVIDSSDIATVTIDKNVTLKADKLNLGQILDNSDLTDGLAGRDAAAINLVVDGTVDAGTIYVSSYSTMTVNQSGKVVYTSQGGDSVLRAGGKIVVNGNGYTADSTDYQWESSWINNHAGVIEFNNTNAKIGTLYLDNDVNNAVLPTETGASLILNESRLEAYGIKNLKADSNVVMDKNSTLIVGAFENNGLINGGKGFVGNITVDSYTGGWVANVGYTLADELTLQAGANFTAGYIYVKDLNLALGSTLTITGTKPSQVENITITGTITGSAQYTLVAAGWDKLGYTGMINYNGATYSVAQNDPSAPTNFEGLYFVSDNNSNLYVKYFSASETVTDLYIGDLTGAVDGKLIVNGISYTVGVNAFTSVAAAADKLGTDNTVKSITLDTGDHVNDVAATFKGTGTINILSGAEVIDTDAAVFGSALTINNDGHLEADITARGDMNIVNTSKNTLTGTYTAQDAGNGYVIDIDNSTGLIEEATFNAHAVKVVGGDGTDVTVNAALLMLEDTNTFELNATSGIFQSSDYDNNSIQLFGSANLTINGDIASTRVEIKADINGNNELHSGTVTFAGTQVYNGQVAGANLVIAEGSDVTFNDVADFVNLTIHGSVNVDLTQQNSFSDAGSVSGKGVLNVNHKNAWVINDSVDRDFSNFTGTVNMVSPATSIVMGLGDAPDYTDAAKDSYFADGTRVNVADSQAIYLAGNGVATGIIFTGTEGAALHVGNMASAQDNSVAVMEDQSEDFTQTLSGDNSGFAGTVNVSEGAQLTLTNELGAKTIDMDFEATQSATDVEDVLDTQLNLAKDGLVIGGNIIGDANDVINVKEDAVLTADNTEFVGIVNIEAGRDLTLKGDLSKENKGEINFATGASLTTVEDVVDEEIVINSILNGGTDANVFVNGDTTLETAEALNGFSGNVAVDSAKTLTLNGDNTTYATFSSTAATAVIDMNADLTLNATGALDNYNGTVEVAENTLTLNGKNVTAAIVTGTDAGQMAVNANNEFTNDDAITDFEGTITFEDGAATELTLSGDNTVSATIVASDADDQLISNADNTITGDLSGFYGMFDVTEGNSITFDGATVLNPIRINDATDGTVTLTDTVAYDVQVDQEGVGGKVSNLNIGGNKVTIGLGTFDNITGTDGTDNTGSVYFTKDDTFQNVQVGDINTTAENDIVIKQAFDADVNMSIKNGNSSADLDLDGDVANVEIGKVVISGSDQITATGNGATVQNYYYLIQTGIDGVSADVTSVNVDGKDIAVGSNMIVGDGTDAHRVFVEILTDAAAGTEDLVLTKKNAFSNYVAINSDWSGTGSVMDGDKYRNMEFDAASNLLDAVEFIQGHKNPYVTTGEGGTGKGDGMISIATDGKYTTNGGYLMTQANTNGDINNREGNGVTNLVLEGREGVVAEINNTLRGSDGSVATSLTINNLKLTGNVYGGGIVTINNGADVRASGTAIAGGLGLEVAGDLSMANDSSLVLNGGTYVNSILAGGSFTDNADAKITVSGETKIEINNTGSEVLTVSRNIYGGSYAAKGEITQSGDAYVVINSSNEVVLRGNIYAAGGNGSGTLNMTGDTFVTFTGDAANLTFTGTVYGDDTTDTVIFKDFAGTFNGSLREVESITISGDSQLELGRRQTTTANTELVFDIDGRFGASSKVERNAMYTVRDMNRWEFSNNIIIDSANNRYDGYDYLLIDNYAGDFADFTFTVAGNTNYTIGDWAYDTNGAAYKLYVNDNNALVLKYVNAANNVNVTTDTDNLEIQNAKIVSISDGVSAKTEDALNLEEINLGSGASLEITSRNRNLTEVTLGNGSTLTLDIADSNSGTMDDLNLQVANAGDTATVIWGEDGNWDYAAGYTVGEGVTLKTEKTVLNGGHTQIDGTVESDYFYMLDAETTVTGTIVAKGDALQVKTGSTLNVDGGEIQAVTSLNVWNGSSELNVSNGSVINLTGGHIHAWDGACKINFTDSTIGYGSDFIVGNAGNGVVMTVDNSTMNQSVANATAVATINTGNLMVVKNDSIINLGAAGMDVKGTGLTSDPGAALEVYDSIINGNIKGGTTYDAIAMDVDSVLNGAVSGIEALDISGITGLSADTVGIKAIAGSVDTAALTDLTLDGVDAVLGAAAQIAGGTTPETTDDIWAGLCTADNGNTLIAWGTSSEMVADTLDAFKSEDLTIGKTMVAAVGADFTTVEKEDYTDKIGKLA